jgi:hypothetical protein
MPTIYTTTHALADGYLTLDEAIADAKINGWADAVEFDTELPEEYPMPTSTPFSAVSTGDLITDPENGDAYLVTATGHHIGNKMRVAVKYYADSDNLNDPTEAEVVVVIGRAGDSLTDAVRWAFEHGYHFQAELVSRDTQHGFGGQEAVVLDATLLRTGAWIVGYVNKSDGRESSFDPECNILRWEAKGQ